MRPSQHRGPTPPSEKKRVRHTHASPLHSSHTSTPQSDETQRSPDHTVFRLTHVDGEANVFRELSSPMRWFLIFPRVARPIRRDYFFAL